MKALAVAQKELTQSFRSLFALFFMLVIPLMMTTLFFLMFGAFDDTGISLPQTTVVVVDLDEPAQITMPPAAEAAGGTTGDVVALGEQLLAILRSEDLASLVTLSEVSDPEAARQAVDAGEAAVALIIPPGFSAALTSGDSQAEVEFYQDPTLTLGPAIVLGLVRSAVDQFLVSRIGIEATIRLAAESGLPVDQALVSEIVSTLAQPESQPDSALVVVRQPAAAGSEAGTTDFTAYIGMILAGQLVFFAFFTGAYALQSVVTEDERGTLQRLFTTPNSHLTIMSGKYLAALLLLAVQFVVLVAVGALIFGIYWGLALSVLLGGIGVAVGAATSGLFLVSLVRTSRQVGSVFGGVLAVTGLIGLMPVFTAALPDPPALINAVALLTPQGWALRGLTQSMSDAGLLAVSLNTAAIFAWSLVLLFIAQRRLRRRFDR